MIGIYKNDFLDYLKDNLGESIKVTHKNIVCRCPWCEVNENKKHYHLWISLEMPIFHCFHSECHKSGTISKLLRRIEGKDLSDQFVDKDLVKASAKKKTNITRVVRKEKNITTPKIREEAFKYKTLYLNKRLKFSNIGIQSIKGLIFDFEEFISSNKISLDEKQQNMLPFLQNNFVGFLTENQAKVVCRNIDPTSTFNHYKLGLQDTQYLDYYKLSGRKRDSKDIILAEGIFDIYAEHIFDYTNLKQSSFLYAAALSTSYHSLIKSIIFHEQIFKPNIHILSDSNISLNYYKKIAKFNKHMIGKLIIYYNKSGDDFNVTPVDPAPYVID